MDYFLLISSVFLGFLIVLLLKPSHKSISLLLAFSGAYLLSVTVLHLLPEVYEHGEENSTKIGIFILGGILIQSLLESFSKGAEHGHIHHHSYQTKFPLLLFISLCIHAFSEGIPIHDENDNLLWAVTVHKIPISIVLSTFLLKSKFSKTTIIFFLGVFGLMSPLGVLVAKKMSFFTEHHTEISSLIIGVFLHISTIILFESSENHKFNMQKFTVILFGILLTIFTLG